MSKELQRHCDCRNYAPVDVVKGICHRTKEMTLGDSNRCEHFVQIAKCRVCTNYTAATEEYMGICNADPLKPWTYPDLIAVTCDSFSN